MPRKICDSLWCLVDSVLAIGVFAPIVVGYWRGCWQLMDHYLFPQNVKYSLWASTTIGLSLGVFFGLSQNCFTRSFPRKKRKCLFVILSRVYTIIYCVVCVNHWRGIWFMWDTYHGLTWQSGATSAGIGLLALAFTRGVRNILAPPFLTVTDQREGYFTVPTLFKAKKEHCCKFLLDVLFSVVVTGSLVVFVWRGAWVFMDRTLFPNDPPSSAWGSLIIGVSVTVISFITQLIMIPCLKRVTNWFSKILLEDLYFTICFVGAINIWRGVWMLLNVYLYPERRVLSNLITTIGGNIVLMCLFNGNSILVRGAHMDGADSGAKGVTLQTQYIRSCLKRNEKKKETLDLWKKKDSINLSSNPRGTKFEQKNGNEFSNTVIDCRGTGDGNSTSEGGVELDQSIVCRSQFPKDILILEQAEDFSFDNAISIEEGETVM